LGDERGDHVQVKATQLVPYLAIFIVMPSVTFLVGRTLDSHLGLPRYPPLPWNLVVGLGMFLGGLWLGLKSTRLLYSLGGGLPWGEARAEAKTSRLVTSGVYAYTRNPMIIGYTVLPFGMGVMFQSPGMALSISPFVLVANVLIVKLVEEPNLVARFGEEYLRYRELTPFLVPRPGDWGDDVHITGPWFPDDPAWEPPPALLRFLDAGAPPAFVGFGSMPLRAPARTVQMVLDALAQAGRRGVVQFALPDDFPLPDSVYPLDYAPYAWLFPQMAGIVHHGGSGTTAFGAASGVPSMTAPFTFDQVYWGQRLAARGVGPAPIPQKSLTPGRLAGALAQMGADGNMRARARALGAKIRAEEGVDRAVQVVESYLR